MRVLIVEDDTLNREMLARLLSREGFQTIGAINGVQAIALARAEQPDLILLDLGLPILDGWQTARRLRTIAETRAIPIIVLTGHVYPDLHQQCRAAGCDDIETKPIDAACLIAKIRLLAGMIQEHGMGERAIEAG